MKTSKEIYGKSTHEHNIEKYIHSVGYNAIADNAGLFSRV